MRLRYESLIAKCPGMKNKNCVQMNFTPKSPKGATAYQPQRGERIPAPKGRAHTSPAQRAGIHVQKRRRGLKDHRITGGLADVFGLRDVRRSFRPLPVSAHQTRGCPPGWYALPLWGSRVCYFLCATHGQRSSRTKRPGDEDGFGGPLQRAHSPTVKRAEHPPAGGPDHRPRLAHMEEPTGEIDNASCCHRGLNR